MNLAILSPPGCVDPVNAAQGLPAKVIALGPLITTIPEPPAPAAFDGPGCAALAPPPPPVLAVPALPQPSIDAFPPPRLFLKTKLSKDSL